jgi:hypothetical protein
LKKISGSAGALKNYFHLSCRLTWFLREAPHYQRLIILSTLLNGIQIMPTQDRVKQLQDDYKLMHEVMLFGNKPSFNELIDDIQKIEKLLNI